MSAVPSTSRTLPRVDQPDLNPNDGPLNAHFSTRKDGFKAENPVPVAPRFLRSKLLARPDPDPETTVDLIPNFVFDHVVSSLTFHGKEP